MWSVSVITKVLLSVLVQVSSAQVGAPPKVEENLLLLESYIPPTMQILAYLTEMMKYNLKPSTPAPIGLVTTSTMRPTPFHRPGVYAPLKPPGPDAYFQSIQMQKSDSDSYKDYLDSLRRPSGLNYFDRYQQFGEATERNSRDFKTTDGDENDDVLKGIEEYFGKNFIEILKLTKDVESDVPNDINEQSQEFLKKYDDSNFRNELLKQKQVPPTRAYVTLLSLYDVLNKESKRLGLSKYNGYTEKMLKDLAETSLNTSAFQLKHVLKKVVDRRDSPRQEILNKINQLIKDLDDSNSYLNLALQYVPPLVFSL